MTETTAMTTIDPIRRALAEATSIDDFKGVRDMASAAQAWAHARGLGIESENDAAECVIRAERGLGLVLTKAEEQGRIAKRSGNNSLQLPTLVELGLGPRPDTFVYLWKRVASLPEEEFEDLLRRARLPDKNGEVRRLAKLDFYGRNHKGPKTHVSETPEDSGFLKFRDGVRSLLGWEEGEYTRNGLLTLPDDELVQIAEYVKALITAYQTAKAARHG
jgi:hypothetical protein